ncbi:pectate lyase-like adhesive domain-containing protein [Solibacillus sp. FSL W8-0372]|uniref:pectate lyase-like adhesive domain-containing protein n=1 Tax=Solibacillus sp. FSL W8-0372 TaxID=2921713 RepID=UPI0030D53549
MKAELAAEAQKQVTVGYSVTVKSYTAATTTDAAKVVFTVSKDGDIADTEELEVTVNITPVVTETAEIEAAKIKDIVVTVLEDASEEQVKAELAAEAQKQVTVGYSVTVKSYTAATTTDAAKVVFTVSKDGDIADTEELEVTVNITPVVTETAEIEAAKIKDIVVTVLEDASEEQVKAELAAEAQKQVTVGYSVTVKSYTAATTTDAAKVVFTVSKDGDIADTEELKVTVTFSPVTGPSTPDVAVVKTYEDLKIALADENIVTIDITNDISDISEAIIVNRAVTINGIGNKLQFTSALNTLENGKRQGILVLADDVKISNLSVEMNGANSWQGVYGIQVYNAENVVLNDITASGADGGILVNGSEVELTGITTVSGNEFGGIEVSKGTAGGLRSSELTVTGDVINVTEVYGQPTIWLLNGQGTVKNVPSWSTNTTIKINQTQYYKNSMNAEDAPILTNLIAKVNDKDVQATTNDSSEVTLKVTKGSVTTEIVATFDKAVELPNGTEVFMKFGDGEEVKYGTIASSDEGKQLIIKPLGNNGTAGVAGTVTFILKSEDGTSLTTLIGVTGNEYKIPTIKLDVTP